MYDLHLHSTYSDGDLSPADLVSVAHEHSVSGVSLTDHNGVWGISEARAAAQRLAMQFIAGIEVTALYSRWSVHLLGLGHTLDAAVLREGLQRTREGYRQRTMHMVNLCHQAGYMDVSFDAIVARRAQQTEPCYMAYDVARELHKKHGLTVQQARRLVVAGGPCHVPYGSWALAPQEAISLIHQAGGVAVLAHPGFVVFDGGSLDDMRGLISVLIAAGLDGLEVLYPYHDAHMVSELRLLAQQHGLIVTGGSDWHGPGRYVKSDEQFGKVGVPEEDFQMLLDRLS